MLVSTTLTSGRCKSLEEYKMFIGKLEGLKEAEEIVTQVYKAMFHTDRLDQQGVKEDVSPELKFY